MQQWQHPIWALLPVKADPFWIQLLANAPGKAGDDGPSTWSQKPMWEARMKLLLLALAWSSTGHCSHSGSQAAEER